MKKINFFSREHLGDNIYQFHYCRKLLQNSNIEIDYYLLQPTDCINFEIFYTELEKHIVDLDRFRLIRSNIYPPDSVNIHINSHQMGKLYFKYTNYPTLDGNKSYNEFYIFFFEQLSKFIGVENPIKTNNDMLMDNPFILNPNKLYTDNFDFLVINSMPNSGQIEKDMTSFDILFEFLLSKNYKVISTEKTKYPEILSTVENNLSLLEIGNLSLNCHNIIGIHTSPIIYTFNKWNIDKIKKWIIFQNNGTTYTFNDRIYNFKSVYDTENIINMI